MDTRSIRDRIDDKLLNAPWSKVRAKPGLDKLMIALSRKRRSYHMPLREQLGVNRGAAKGYPLARPRTNHARKSAEKRANRWREIPGGLPF